MASAVECTCHVSFYDHFLLELFLYGLNPFVGNNSIRNWIKLGIAVYYTVLVLTNVKCEASRHFRNKKKAYLKAKIEDLETNSKVKNIRDLYRGINDFKKGYRPRTNIVKDETGDLVTGSYSILLGGGTIYPSYWMYMGSMVLGRQKHTQQNH